jgi:hypothetical protein
VKEMSNGNGSANTVRLGFELIRGSPPLWSAYKHEQIVIRDLVGIINWMSQVNIDLWKKLSRHQAEIDERLKQRFAQAVTSTPLWVAMKTEQITPKEFRQEILCRKSGPTISLPDELLLTELALEALKN